MITGILLDILLWIVGILSINFICYIIAYCISFSNKVETKVRRSDWLVGLFIGVLMVLTVILNGILNYIGMPRLKKFFDFLDYHFDPKLKDKRILDKQIEEFRKSIK